MTKPKTVFVVHHGEYTGRYLSGIYSTLDKAMEDAGESGDIEEAILDRDDQDTPLTLGLFSIRMRRDGNIQSATRIFWRNPSEAKYTIGNVGTWYGVPRYASCLSAVVWAQDETHAVNLVNEYRDLAIASNEWPPDSLPALTESDWDEIRNAKGSPVVIDRLLAALGENQ